MKQKGDVPFAFSPSLSPHPSICELDPSHSSSDIEKCPGISVPTLTLENSLSTEDHSVFESTGSMKSKPTLPDLTLNSEVAIIKTEEFSSVVSISCQVIANCVSKKENPIEWIEFGTRECKPADGSAGLAIMSTSLSSEMPLIASSNKKPAPDTFLNTFTNEGSVTDPGCFSESINTWQLEDDNDNVTNYKKQNNSRCKTMMSTSQYCNCDHGTDFPIVAAFPVSDAPKEEKAPFSPQLKANNFCQPTSSNLSDKMSTIPSASLLIVGDAGISSQNSLAITSSLKSHASTLPEAVVVTTPPPPPPVSTIETKTSSETVRRRGRPPYVIRRALRTKRGYNCSHRDIFPSTGTYFQASSPRLSPSSGSSSASTTTTFASYPTALPITHLALSSRKRLASPAEEAESIKFQQKIAFSHSNGSVSLPRSRPRGRPPLRQNDTRRLFTPSQFVDSPLKYASKENSSFAADPVEYNSSGLKDLLRLRDFATESIEISSKAEDAEDTTGEIELPRTLSTSSSSINFERPSSAATVSRDVLATFLASCFSNRKVMAHVNDALTILHGQNKGWKNAALRGDLQGDKRLGRRTRGRKSIFSTLHNRGVLERGQDRFGLRRGRPRSSPRRALSSLFGRRRPGSRISFSSSAILTEETLRHPTFCPTNLATKPLRRRYISSKEGKDIVVGELWLEFVGWRRCRRQIWYLPLEDVWEARTQFLVDGMLKEKRNRFDVASYGQKEAQEAALKFHQEAETMTKPVESSSFASLVSSTASTLVMSSTASSPPANTLAASSDLALSKTTPWPLHEDDTLEVASSGESSLSEARQSPVSLSSSKFLETAKSNLYKEEWETSTDEIVMPQSPRLPRSRTMSYRPRGASVGRRRRLYRRASFSIGRREFLTGVGLRSLASTMHKTSGGSLSYTAHGENQACFHMRRMGRGRPPGSRRGRKPGWSRMSLRSRRGGRRGRGASRVSLFLVSPNESKKNAYQRRYMQGTPSSTEDEECREAEEDFKHSFPSLLYEEGEHGDSVMESEMESEAEEWPLKHVTAHHRPASSSEALTDFLMPNEKLLEAMEVQAIDCSTQTRWRKFLRWRTRCEKFMDAEHRRIDLAFVQAMKQAWTKHVQRSNHGAKEIVSEEERSMKQLAPSWISGEETTNFHSIKEEGYANAEGESLYGPRYSKTKELSNIEEEAEEGGSRKRAICNSWMGYPYDLRCENGLTHDKFSMFDGALPQDASTGVEDLSVASCSPSNTRKNLSSDSQNFSNLDTLPFKSFSQPFLDRLQRTRRFNEAFLSSKRRRLRRSAKEAFLAGYTTSLPITTKRNYGWRSYPGERMMSNIREKRVYTRSCSVSKIVEAAINNYARLYRNKIVQVKGQFGGQGGVITTVLPFHMYASMMKYIERPCNWSKWMPSCAVEKPSTRRFSLEVSKVRCSSFEGTNATLPLLGETEDVSPLSEETKVTPPLSESTDATPSLLETVNDTPLSLEPVEVTSPLLKHVEDASFLERRSPSVVDRACTFTSSNAGSSIKQMLAADCQDGSETPGGEQGVTSDLDKVVEVEGIDEKAGWASLQLAPLEVQSRASMGTPESSKDGNICREVGSFSDSNLRVATHKASSTPFLSVSVRPSSLPLFMPAHTSLSLVQPLLIDIPYTGTYDYLSPFHGTDKMHTHLNSVARVDEAFEWMHRQLSITKPHHVPPQ